MIYPEDPKNRAEQHVVKKAIAGNTNSTTTSSAIAAPGATGKVTKRKSRAASKKSQATFITADPANFRQMVQQVTAGFQFTDAMVLVLKPEPHRLGRGGSIQLQQHHVAAAAAAGGGGGGGGLLPTLDTSAFGFHFAFNGRVAQLSTSFD